MIFILGTERSASTWVANILDHHHNMDVYMEPLSSFNSRFKDWPNRFAGFDNLEKKAKEFEYEFEILRKHNRFFLTRLSASPHAWQTDLKWAQFLVKKGLAPDSVMDFMELNFHRKNRQIPVKKREPLQTVIKEVRLNFNADMVSKIDADPKVIVTIRDMASCVYSMKKFMEQGHLTDLKKDLEKQYEKTDAKTLCRYWFESYSVLLEALEDQKISNKIVSHSDLLVSPLNEAKKIFHFLNLPFASQVKKYLDSSNKAGEGAHSTNRSREELLQQIQIDRNHIYPLIREKLLQQVQNHPILKKFV